MQDKRAYGFGPVAQKMQNDIDTKRGEKDKYVNEKRTSVESWRKQLDQVNTKINTLADDLRIEYKENEHYFYAKIRIWVYNPLNGHNCQMVYSVWAFLRVFLWYWQQAPQEQVFFVFG